MKKYIYLLIILSLTQCKTKTKGVITKNAMVVCAREEASEIGVDIMKKGGNAFDAMIATDLALAVSYPFAGNIGGGGFMVYRTKDGKVGALDYREKAPLATNRNFYLDEDENVIPKKSTLGANAVGVPGTIAGLFKVHQKFGTIPFNELIQPAIDLAKKGVVVTKKQARLINRYRKRFEKANNRVIFISKKWKKGDTIKYIKLAETLERIRDNGRDEFYKGKTANMLVNYIQDLGGVITKEDLEKYEAKWRKPVSFKYKDATIHSMSPPSSGGICMAQILKSVEPFNIKQYKHNSVKYIQLITESERRAYADRAHFLGDSDFIHIAIDSLISKEYLNHRMKSFSWDKANTSTEISHGKLNHIESNETTHYSIVDSFGNAVAVTTTLNSGFGSKVCVKEGGFFLNNEMDDFSIKPGVANSYGLVGAEANAIAPEKRMLSSMSPTIVEQNGKLKMVLGSPGGSTIITSVMQNILNVVDYNMGMQESVSQPRFHHQWLPDNIKFEPRFNKSVFTHLEKLGYKIDQSKAPVIGKVDAILVLSNGYLEGGADPRGDDKAVGY
ncbi:MAG TPA: gamma-glutamyltransferase [Flavobacteriaceae bacterium]|nr:gamma-glutamyltransferase [Flavobacteriaceae bacterium]HIP26048.1 gamma-glutamyltransferase [Flavobacteriaceae bacterium]